MCRKIFNAVILTIFSLLVLIPVFATEYHDVTKDKWYYNDIMLATHEGVLVCKDQNTFEPDSYLKICEAITAVAKLHAKMKDATIQTFENELWYKPYVDYALANNIIRQGQFNNYEHNITRLDFAVLCYNITTVKQGDIKNHIENIPDLDKNAAGYTEVEALYNLGIIVGSDACGTFEPGRNLTRAEMCVALNRISHFERRVKTEFKTAESVRYENFKNRVTEENCTPRKIFVSCDTYTVGQEKLDKLQAAINRFGGICGFYLVTLDGKFSIGYNIDQKIASASTVKAPYTLYCVKQIESGNGTLNEMKAYQKKHTCGKSGTIKNSPYGTEFSLEYILNNTIHISDNVGYYMLQDRFGISGYNDFLDDIGCSRMKLTGSMKWGYVYPREVALIWNEIYNYSQTSDYGAKLFDLFVNAKFNFIKEAYISKYKKLDYQIAHKSGFNDNGRHDEAIVLRDDAPYFITITTKPKDDGSEVAYLKNTALILEGIMQDYIAHVKKQ